MLGLALAASGGLALLITAEALALPWLIWPATVVHGATALGSNAVVMLSVIGFARRAVGAASGVLAFGLYLGFTVGPLAFGFAVDGRPEFTPAWEPWLPTSPRRYLLRCGGGWLEIAGAVSRRRNCHSVRVRPGKSTDEPGDAHCRRDLQTVCHAD